MTFEQVVWTVWIVAVGLLFHNIMSHRGDR